MKKILLLFGSLVGGILLFGLYKHNFDVSAYIKYVATEGIVNFTADFDVSNPSTRLRFLYPAGEAGSETKKEELDPLDAELAKLAEMIGGESTQETGQAMNSLSGEIQVSNSLSGEVNAQNDAASSLSGGEIPSSNQEKTGYTFDDFEKFFDENSLNVSNENSTGNVSTLLTGSSPSLPASSLSGAASEAKVPSKQTQSTGTTSQLGTGSTISESMHTGTKAEQVANYKKEEKATFPVGQTGGKSTETGTSALPTKTGSKTETSYEAQLSPLLQKRLEQYREFKKTLKKE